MRNDRVDPGAFLLSEQLLRIGVQFQQDLSRLHVTPHNQSASSDATGGFGLNRGGGALDLKAGHVGDLIATDARQEEPSRPREKQRDGSGDPAKGPPPAVVAEGAQSSNECGIHGMPPDVEREALARGAQSFSECPLVVVER